MDSPPVLPRRRLRPVRQLQPEVTPPNPAPPPRMRRLRRVIEDSDDEAPKKHEEAHEEPTKPCPEPPAPEASAAKENQSGRRGRLRKLADRLTVNQPADKAMLQTAAQDEPLPPPPRRSAPPRPQASDMASLDQDDETEDEDMSEAEAEDESPPPPRRSARLQRQAKAPRAHDDDSEDEDMWEPQAVEEPPLRRRSARLRDRAALRAPGEDTLHKQQHLPTKEGSPDRTKRPSIYDSEESDDGAANELAQAMRTTGGNGSRSSNRAPRSLGSDNDPEVATWREDLARRWSDSTGQRPSAAFSNALLDRSQIRMLPQECRLAGYPVFDAAGKVNLSLLLGAHKQLLAGGSSSPGARQVGWLARQALGLELVDASQLKSGRVAVLNKGPARKKAKMTTLIPLEEVRWPSQKKKAGHRADGSLFSDGEDSEEEEVKRARTQEALMNQLREAVKKSEARRQTLSATSVDIKAVKEAALAPKLSFDLYEPEQTDPDADVLEVLPPEGVSRASLLRNKVQQQLFAAAARGLVTEEPQKAATEDRASTEPSEKVEPRMDMDTAPASEKDTKQEVPATAAENPTPGTQPCTAPDSPKAAASDKVSASPGKDSQQLQEEDSQGSTACTDFYDPDSEEEPAPEEDEEEADAADSMSDNSWPEDEDWTDVHGYRRSRQRVMNKEAKQYREEWKQKLKDAKILGKEYLDSILSKEDFIRSRNITRKARPPCDGQKTAGEKAVLWLRGDEDNLEDVFGGFRPKKTHKKLSFLTNFQP